MKKTLSLTLIILALALFVSGGAVFAKSTTDVVKNKVTTLTEPININTADAEELTQLKGVGPKIAERIVDYRKQIGKFKAIEEIMEVKGIGEKTFEAIKPFIKIL